MKQTKIQHSVQIVEAKSEFSTPQWPYELTKITMTNKNKKLKGRKAQINLWTKKLRRRRWCSNRWSKGSKGSEEIRVWRHRKRRSSYVHRTQTSSKWQHSTGFCVSCRLFFFCFFWTFAYVDCLLLRLI